MAETDPLLPSRLRRLAWFGRGEDRVSRSWLGAMRRWLETVRPAVMAPFTSAGNPPNAGGVFTDSGLWQRLTDADVIPEIRDIFAHPYSGIAPDADPNVDPWAIRYLEGVRNRLVNIPNEVYSEIIGEVERGIRQGTSIPDIASSIDQRLLDAGSARWTSRATMIARTETIGASNGGAFAAAIRRAQDEGELFPEKVWIATLDRRTRPAHQVADAQRVALLDPFQVGGAGLQFPGDPSGPAAQVINCRCSTLYVVAGETLDWTDRQMVRDE